tara:strand:+ start:243 stop:479 length:237 start_codon:yes stop_codon:yes gene_type:complete
MSALVFVAVHIVKPALFILMILSCLSAAIYLTTNNKGAKHMRKVDAQQIRKMIKVFGRTKVRAILKEKGLTFEDLGIR